MGSFEISARNLSFQIPHMPELTSIFDVIDSVVFVAGLAIGAAGRHGIDFLLYALDALRGRDRANDPEQ